MISFISFIVLNSVHSAPATDYTKVLHARASDSRLLSSHVSTLGVTILSEQLFQNGENFNFNVDDNWKTWAENPNNFECSQLFPNGNFDDERANQMISDIGCQGDCLSTTTLLLKEAVTSTCLLTTGKQPVIDEVLQILQNLYMPNIIDIKNAMAAEVENPQIKFIQVKNWFGNHYINIGAIRDAFFADAVSLIALDSLAYTYAVELTLKLGEISNDFFVAEDFNFISRSMAITINNYYGSSIAEPILMKFAKSITQKNPAIMFNWVETTLSSAIRATDYFGHNTFILTIENEVGENEIKRFTYPTINTIQQFQEDLGFFADGKNYHLSIDASEPVFKLGQTNPQITMTLTEQGKHGRELFFFPHWNACSAFSLSGKQSLYTLTVDLGPIVHADMDICFFSKNSQDSIDTSSVQRILPDQVGLIVLGIPPHKFFRGYEHNEGGSCSGRDLTRMENLETAAVVDGSNLTVKLASIIHPCDSCQQDDLRRRRSLQTRDLEETPKIGFEGKNLLEGTWDQKLSLDFYVKSMVETTSRLGAFSLPVGETNYFISKLEDTCPAGNNSPALVDFEFYSPSDANYVWPFEVQETGDDEKEDTHYYWLQLRSKDKLLLTELTKLDSGISSTTHSKYVAITAKADIDSKKLEIVEVVAADSEKEALGNDAIQGVNIEFIGSGKESCKSYDYMSWFEGVRENIRNIIKPESITKGLGLGLKHYFEYSFQTASAGSTKTVRSCFYNILNALDNGEPIRVDKCNASQNKCTNCYRSSADAGSTQAPGKKAAVLTLGPNFNNGNIMNKTPMEEPTSIQGALIHELTHYFCSTHDGSSIQTTTPNEGTYNEVNLQNKKWTKSKKNADSYRVYFELLVLGIDLSTLKY
jgi:hypothetical protein